MELLDAIRSRRSVKHFDPACEMDDNELKHLFEHVALSPTSFNMQNWHFVAVRDKAVKQELCAAAFNQEQVRDAALVVVCTGALKAHRRTDRYLRNAPEATAKSLTSMIMGFYDENEELRMQEACRTVGIAAQTMMLMAREMGYDSCPMIGFDPKKVSECIGLDAHHPPLLMVTIGKPLQPARPRMGLLDLQEFVSLDKFGQHTLTGEVPEH